MRLRDLHSLPSNLFVFCSCNSFIFEAISIFSLVAISAFPLSRIEFPLYSLSLSLALSKSLSVSVVLTLSFSLALSYSLFALFLSLLPALCHSQRQTLSFWPFQFIVRALRFVFTFCHSIQLRCMFFCFVSSRSLYLKSRNCNGTRFIWYLVKPSRKITILSNLNKFQMEHFFVSIRLGRFGIW